MTTATPSLPVGPPAVLDEFNAEERKTLERFASNLDKHTFVLKGLPEVVKGAAFARYSRSSKSLRRLLVDDFGDDLAAIAGTSNPNEAQKAAALYDRVFSEYGDDSVAQLGGAHAALEQVSNLATKQIEWGRLAAYLEQSTRYIDYSAKIDGRYRYYAAPEVMGGPHASLYVETMDRIFDLYAELVPQIIERVRAEFPKDDDTSAFVWRNATKAKGLDLIRGMLPAATTSNVGMYASGQSWEGLLLRMQASELAECRNLAADLLPELRTVIAPFLTRVDREDRGVAWSNFLAATRDEMQQRAGALDLSPEPAEEVTLIDASPMDPAEARAALATAALYASVAVPEEQLRAHVDALSSDDQEAIIRAYVGERRNRRHKPGRGFERVSYRFDVLGDYGGFRDLQRHRMLTIEWQHLTSAHGYETPSELEEYGLDGPWHEALKLSADLHATLVAAHGPAVAQYAVCFAYRVRYTMQMNARAAMQMLELRSTPQGHPQYRRIVQKMHTLIREAGHDFVADAMSYVDHGAAELERLDAERAAEKRREARAQN